METVIIAGAVVLVVLTTLYWRWTARRSQNRRGYMAWISGKD